MKFRKYNKNNSKNYLNYLLIKHHDYNPFKWIN
jgi:hypothetical protein